MKTPPTRKKSQKEGLSADGSSLLTLTGTKLQVSTPSRPKNKEKDEKNLSIEGVAVLAGLRKLWVQVQINSNVYHICSLCTDFTSTKTILNPNRGDANSGTIKGTFRKDRCAKHMLISKVNQFCQVKS